MEVVQKWIKNVVGGAISSKKTLATGGAIASIALIAFKTNPTIAIVCATICFLGWLVSQAYTDGKRIDNGHKE